MSARPKIGSSSVVFLSLCGIVMPAAMAAGPAAVEATVLENAPHTITIDFKFGPYGTRAVEVDGVPHTALVLGEEPALLRAGAPEVPHCVRSVILPADTWAEVQVDPARSSYVDVAEVNLVPSKGNLPRTIDPDTVPYAKGAEYGVDAFYPGEVCVLHEPYMLRDVRGVAVDVFPFQYNPVQQVLRVYTRVTVQVKPHGTVGLAAALDQPARPPSRAFEEIYATHFINYTPPARYNPMDEDGSLLIICHDAWLPNVQPLVTHKNAVGITTTAVGVSTIGNNSTAIKNYIQSVYNQGDLAFVLLVGDAAQIATPTASGGSSDPSYSKLAGGDNYPDILIGRFSAETAAHVDTQVQRTIEYETLPATQATWFWKGVGIASAQGAGVGDDGEADYVHMGYIRNDLLAYGFTVVDEIYDTNGGTAAMVSAAVNNGRGIINYCGHGSTTAWSTTGFSNTHVNALTNHNMLPFIVSVACVNGQFNGYTCFAEAWMRATNSSEPTGAIGMYASSINQDWAPPMSAQDEIVDLFCAETYHTMGALCFAGSCKMMDEYGSGASSDGTNMFNTWHVFGDPSLRVVGTYAPTTGLDVTPETPLHAEGPEGGPFVPAGASYTLMNRNTVPMPYEVTASAPWVGLSNASGTIPAGGTTSVNVSFSAAAGDLLLGLHAATVTFTNLYDHEGDTARDVTLKVGVPEPVYTFPLDTNPGWAMQGEWAFGQPTGGGGAAHLYPDPSAGATGTQVYGVNLNGDYSTAFGGPYYLTAGPFDLRGVSEVSLHFQRWLNTDHVPYVYETVDVSVNGTDWANVWTNPATVLRENGWSAQAYDLPTAADKPGVYVRWGYKINGSALAFSGWNIDDIEIWGLGAPPASGACCLAGQTCIVAAEPDCAAVHGGTFAGAGTACDPNPCVPPVCRGDADCDGTVGFADIDYFVAAIPNNQAAWAALFPGGPSCTFDNVDVNGDGTVGFDDIDPFVARIPSTCP